MRILQVHTRYRQKGGEDAVVAEERTLLRAAGHQVESVEFSNPAGRREASAVLIRSPWNRSPSVEVLEAAERGNAEVVHVHNTWFALTPYVFRALNSANIPTVATIHNYRNVCVNALLYREGGICEFCVGKLPWKGIRFRCYRGSALQSAAVAVTIGAHRKARTWDYPDVVIALTEFAVRLLEEGGIPPSSIVVKPNYVPDIGPRPTPPSASDSVIFVGRLSEEKGVMDLLEAWKRTELTDLRLLIIGDGPLRGLVESTAEAIEAVEVLGPLDEGRVGEVMKSARILALPSRWYEGMPMVLLEASAAGLGTIVPNHGGLVEAAGRGGLLFDGGSVASLSEALSRVGDDDLVEQLGSAARAQYEARFSPSVALRALERVYQLALDRRSTGPLGQISGVE